jgi:CheY-like chemotaxis protein
MSKARTSDRILDKSLRVLVVDDSRTSCEIVVRILKNIGFDSAESCQNGAEALVRLRTLKFGALVTDLEMSPMSGLDLISCVRSDPMLHQLPVILMTAKYDQLSNMVRHKVASGADIHILKPFTPSALLEKIQMRFAVDNFLE